MRKWVVLVFSLLTGCLAFAGNPVVNFDLTYTTVNLTGKPAKAIAINGQFPGPTLHFKYGDHVTINVHNHLDVPTTIHWHGIIPPWRMDGVPMVSQLPIPPGGVFHYKFTLHQYGTYWYHSHYKLQEQEGQYGAIIIDPPKPKIKFDKQFVLLLGDWNNTWGTSIFNDLKKTGEFFGPKFPLQPSLVRFIHDYRKATPAGKKRLKRVYLMMQKTRMGAYDISDIAYDTFIINGHPSQNPWIGKVKVGDRVRLRIIGSSSSAIFRVKIPGQKIHIISVDGNIVIPYTVDNFTVAPGETYNVLLTIKKPKPYIIYAESSDTVGSAVAALVTSKKQHINFKSIKPFPLPKPRMMSMRKIPELSKIKVSTVTKYANLSSPEITNNPNTPTHIVKLVLGGWMERYVWFINGVPEYKAKPIMITNGQHYRFIFINKTLMHHPMHIHGHWFVLRNGHGAHDPLLHTIDVPPGGIVVADINANEIGQWYFHCHNLYHMIAGMANIVRYTTPPGRRPLSFLPGEVIPGRYFMGNLAVEADPFNSTYQSTLLILYGTDYNKLQLFMNEAELDKNTIENADMDIFYWHPISQFWAIKGGLNYVYRPAENNHPYLQPGIGIEGTMPYFIQTNLRIYNHKGSTKFDLEFTRNTQITNRFYIQLGLRGIAATKTLTDDEIGSGFNMLEATVRPYYSISTNFDIYFEYEYNRFYGERKKIVLAEGDSARVNSYSFGLSVLF